VLAVSGREITRNEKDRLLTHLFVLSGPYPTAGQSRPLEVTIVVSSEMRPWRYPPRREFQYGEWWRERFERRDPLLWQPVTDPDLAILVTMVLLGDVTLAGPTASELLDPVPRADFVDAVLSELPGLMADIPHSDTRNVVLTLARIWYSMVAGGVVAKDAAAEWALTQLPEHRAVLARARDIYLGVDQENWEDLQDAIRPFADAIVAEIGSARSESASLSIHP
jgi:hypothetical protein